MLNTLISHQVIMGLLQAGAAIALALVVTWIARTRAIHLEREVVVALIRGLVQVVAVGSILGLLLGGPRWTSVIILAAMVAAAATISARRAEGIPDAFRVSLYSIGFGSAVVIIPMTLLGAIDSSISSLVPVGSMLIANAMNSNALALDRFKAEVLSHSGQIEAGLALGAKPQVTVRPYVQASIQAAMIPRVDTLRSLGIVWIPGIMAGMILAGTNPVYAAIYQFVVIAMIFAAAGLTSLASMLLIRSKAFSDADQLVLRSKVVEEEA